MASKKEKKNKHLYYLDELSDYKVASGEPDIRGWVVKDADNRVVGKVDNLLVNKEIEKVVYVDVEVDETIIDANHDPYSASSSEEIHEFMNKEGENHLIVPIGLVQLNEDQKYVYTDRINHQTFAETKRMARGTNVNREYEVVVLESYNRDEDRARETRRRSSEDDVLANDPAYKEVRRADSRSDINKKGRIPDDDSLYDRREFDARNYRQRRE